MYPTDSNRSVSTGTIFTSGTCSATNFLSVGNLKLFYRKKENSSRKINAKGRRRIGRPPLQLLPDHNSTTARASVRLLLPSFSCERDNPKSDRGLICRRQNILSPGARNKVRSRNCPATSQSFPSV